MSSWYEFKFIIGGFGFYSVKSPIYLDSAHEMSIKWSVHGLLVKNRMSDTEVRYADNTVISLDMPDVLLPWEMLAKGETEFVIDGITKAVCVVWKESSIDKWETFKANIDESDAFHFDLYLKMLQTLGTSSISKVDSYLNWLKDRMADDYIDDIGAEPYQRYWQRQRLDLFYKELFSTNVFDTMPISRKKQQRKAIKVIYTDIVSTDF